MQAESTRKRDVENNDKAANKRIKPNSLSGGSDNASKGFRHEPENAKLAVKGSRALKNDDDFSITREGRSEIPNIDNDIGMSNKVHRFESGLMTFPEKLMMLLDGNCVNEAMWWLPDGDAFCFIPNLFAEKVLDRHFQGTKFESFTRKLNRWGFKRVAGQKVPTNAVAYYHNSFTRGRPDLIKTMTGGKMKTGKKSRTNIRSRSNSIQTATTQHSDSRSPVLRADHNDNSHLMQSPSPNQVRSGIASLSPNQMHPGIQALISNRITGNQDLMDQGRALNAPRRVDVARDAPMNADLNMLLLADRNSPLISELATRLLVGRSVGLKTNDSASVGGAASRPDNPSLSTASDFLLAHMLSQRGLDHNERIFGSNATAAATGSSNLGVESNILNQLLARNAAQTGPLLSNPGLLLTQRLGSTIPNHQMNLNLASVPRGDTVNEANAVKLANLVSAQQNAQIGGLLGTVRPNVAGSLNWNSGVERTIDSDRELTREQLIRAYLLEQQHRSIQQHLGGGAAAATAVAPAGNTGGDTSPQDRIDKKMVGNHRVPY